MRPIVLLVALPAAALPACGGSDGVTEYRERAERLCRNAERDSERLAKGIDRLAALVRALESSPPIRPATRATTWRER